MVNRESELLEILSSCQNNKDEKGEVDSMLNLSEYYYNKGDFYNAKKFLTALHRYDSNITNINYYLAQVYIQLGNFDEGVKYLKKELNVNPKNVDAHILLEKIKIKSNWPVITIVLLLLNSIVFFYMYPEPSFTELVKYAVSDKTQFIANSLTSIFMHANIFHFAINQIILLLFGLVGEKFVGSFRFLLIYIITGIFGNLMQTVMVSDFSFVLGASSALFGIIALIVIREPLLETRLFGIFKIPLILLFGSYFAISSFMADYFSGFFYSIGDVAHLFGFLSGVFLTSIFYMERIRYFYNWVVIFFGFMMIKYSIDIYITLFNSFDTIMAIVSSSIFIGGFFLIAYSYGILVLTRNKIEVVK